MRIILFVILCALSMTLSAAAPGIELDKAPIDTTDNASLQRGAKTFVNYCLSCHGASYMRYNRHQRDIDFSKAEVKDELVLTGQKVGDLMLAAMRGKEAEQWFGVLPPDLSVIARSRGPDWLYTYLRSFYRDAETASGWNNLVFDRVAMPHVLYEQQGEQKLVDKAGAKSLALVAPGTMSAAEFDKYVGDLVNYLVYLGEPAANDRKQLGIIVMIFLFALLGLSIALKREYWKDIH